MFSQSWKMYLTDIKKLKHAVAEERNVCQKSQNVCHTLHVKTLWMLLKADSNKTQKQLKLFPKLVMNKKLIWLDLWITWK